MRAGQKKYKHITLEERVKIYTMFQQGVKGREIGRRIGRDVGTISRELKRNRSRWTKEYEPVKAHEIAIKKEKRQRTKAPLKNPHVWLYVRDKIKLGWSPETIEGRLPLEYPQEYISYETIYQYIYGKGKKYKLSQYLVLGRKNRMKKEGRRIRRDSRIPDAVSIDRRPRSIDTRRYIGHWESDNMEGKKADKTAVSGSVERVTRYTKLSKVVGKKATSKIDEVSNDLSIFPKKFRKTVTLDNGSENFYHKELKRRLGVNVYFCHAYHSWEKGTVENTFGRLRRYIPKGTSVDDISEVQLQVIEDMMNNTPRKCLGFLTPLEKKLQVLRGTISMPPVALQL